jgi:PD-(D/E)XK nuclease superfamily
MAEEIIDSGLFQRLELFFDQARDTLRIVSKEGAADDQIDIDKLDRMIKKLRAPLEIAESRTCSNPWLAAGLGHDELRVSTVLATLWDRRQYGDDARTFLAGFLASAGCEYPDEAELSDGYQVQTEHCLNGSIADRIDITVETRSSIVGIEVKIYAGEGQNQLSRYVSAIEARARLTRRKAHNVIFLSPYPPKEESAKVAKVTWRVVSEIAARADQSTHAGWLIGQFGKFCHSLGS